MKNPNIVFTKPNVAEVVDRPKPEPGPGQVGVRLVRSCISSGTERANLIGVPDGGVGILGNAATTTFPRQSGYSSAGVVERLGAGVTSIAVGDRVAMSWTVHSQFVCVPEAQAYRIPDGISFEHAALTHISTFPMAAVRKCRLEIGEGAIVMGQGVLGQLAVIILRAAGATPVIAADPDAAKRARALELGADAALDPSASDFAAQAKALCTNERKFIDDRVKFDGPAVGIEVTGVGMALDNVLDAIAPMGRIALLGCTRNSNFTIDYYHKVHGRGVTLVGAHARARVEFESAPGCWTLRDDAQAFLKLLASKRISLDGFVDEVHPMSNAPAVYARLATEATFPVVQFDWGASTY
ncbi:MAG: zinc-dependent alcohol dehydrogenase [Kiritimatiellia bacterium]